MLTSARERILNRRRALLGAVAGVTTATMSRTAAFGQTPAASPAAGDVSVWPNAKTLTPEQRTAYTDAILAMKVKPSPWIAGLPVYDTFVSWHAPCH